MTRDPLFPRYASYTREHHIKFSMYRGRVGLFQRASYVIIHDTTAIGPHIGPCGIRNVNKWIAHLSIHELYPDHDAGGFNQPPPHDRFETVRRKGLFLSLTNQLSLPCFYEQVLPHQLRGPVSKNVYPPFRENKLGSKT